ncbi:hypothetical protein [Pseudomonas leptonychotis]|uniref:DUF2569 family protein n=1 Tax=Pseudomonas leptonychotis TaxID=2448482 RepID=A0A4T1ZQ85_9PSED|nr:hypothetical protein [Pseudomonas leptonychotis]TIH06233.1 hypothetical protein D8779_20380 [Pseudomonas leptonychotis]
MSENPYAPPQSELVGTDNLNRNIAWKVYFYFMLALTFVGVVGLLTVEDAGAAEFISLILAIPSLTGFFGYVFSKKILTRKLWVINFYVQITWLVLYYFVTTADLSAGMDQQLYVVSTAVMWALSIPYYIALFLYANKKYPIWLEKA